MGVSLYLQIIRFVMANAYQTFILLRSFYMWIKKQIKRFLAWIRTKAHNLASWLTPLFRHFPDQLRKAWYIFSELLFFAGATAAFILVYCVIWTR